MRKQRGWKVSEVKRKLLFCRPGKKEKGLNQEILGIENVLNPSKNFKFHMNLLQFYNRFQVGPSYGLQQSNKRI